MSEQIIEQSYVEELPVLTPQQKVELIKKHVIYQLREKDLSDALNEDVGLSLYVMNRKKRYYPDKSDLKTLAPFIIGNVTGPEELIGYVYSFMVTTCEPVDFTTLTVEQCVKNVLDLDIPNLDPLQLAQLVFKIYDYFTETETNKLTYLKQRMLDFKEFEDFPYERWNKYEAQLVKIAFILFNIEEKKLKDFGLSATDDWKRFFIDYYHIDKMKQLMNCDFYDCYPDLVNKVEREIEFNELEVDDEDHFDINKVLEEFKKNDEKKAKSKGGKSTKRNHTIPVRLRNLHTGKVVVFDDTTQCTQYLKVSASTLKRFKRGQKTVLDNDWQVVQIDK